MVDVVVVVPLRLGTVRVTELEVDVEEEVALTLLRNGELLDPRELEGFNRLPGVDEVALYEDKRLAEVLLVPEALRLSRLLEAFEALEDDDAPNEDGGGR